MIATLLLTLAAVQPPIVLVPCGGFTVTGGEAVAVDFDREGRRMLTSGSFGDLVLWDLATLETVGGIAFAREDAIASALHPGGWLAGVVIHRRDHAEILLVDVVLGRTLDRRRVLDGVVGLAWDQRGDILAVRTQQATILAALAAQGVPRFATVRESRESAGARWQEDVGLAAFQGRWRGYLGAAQCVVGHSLDPAGAALLCAHASARWTARVPSGASTLIADSEGQIHAVRHNGVRVLSGHLGPADTVVFTADGRNLVARGQGAVTLATREGKVVRRIPGTAAVAVVAGRPEAWLVRRDEAVLVDARTGEVLQRRPVSARESFDIEAGVSSFLGGRFGWFEQQAVALGTSLVLNSSGGRPVRWSQDGSAPLPGAAGFENRPHLFVRSRDGRLCAALEAEVPPSCGTGYAPPATPGVIHAWTGAGTLLFEVRSTANMVAAAYSPAGDTLAVALRPGPSVPWWPTVREQTPGIEVRNARTGAVRLRRPAAEIDWLGYAGDDTLLALSGTRLEVFDAHTLVVRQAIELCGEPFTAADVAPDGSCLAVARGTRVELFDLVR